MFSSRLTEDLREAYGNFSQGLRRKTWRLTEEIFHKEGDLAVF